MPKLPATIRRLAAEHQRALLELGPGSDLLADASAGIVDQLAAKIAQAAPGSYRAGKLRLARVLAQVAANTFTNQTAHQLNTAITNAILAAELDSVDELDAWAKHHKTTLPPVPIRPAHEVLVRARMETAAPSVAAYDAAIRRRITTAIAQGLLDTVTTREELVDQVKTIAGAERWRADRIVRTELMNAYNATKHATLLEARDSGLAPDIQKTCIVTYDNRTAPDSLPLDGQVRALDEPFVDGKGRTYQHPPGRPNDREVEVPWMPEPNIDEAAAPALLDDDDAQTHADKVAGDTASVISSALKLDEPLPAAPILEDTQQRAAELEARAAELRAQAAALRAQADALRAQADALASPARAPAWPDDPAGLEVVNALGGSTGAELVRAADGALYVRKRGSSPAHLEEECFADALYQGQGVAVPDFRLYRDAGGQPTYKLSRYLPDARSLADISRSDPALFERVKSKLQEDFWLDALLGNWDVIGLSMDNILVTPDGTPYRVDNGGSLRFRAQGAKKPAGAFEGSAILDFWTMRDPKVNQQAARIFGNIDYDDQLRRGYDVMLKTINVEAGRLLVQRDDLTIPAGLWDVLRGRLDELGDLHDINQALAADKVRPAYRSDLALEIQHLRAAGITRRLPAALTPQRNADGTPDPTRVLDLNGDNFDRLRGPSGLVQDFGAHVARRGGSFKAIQTYTKSQGSASWNLEPRGIKYWWVNEVVDRGDPERAYYWQGGYAGAKTGWDSLTARFGAEHMRRSLTAYHAMTMETLRWVSMPGFMSNPDGTFNLIRTEADFIPQTYFPGAKVGDTIAPYLRGAMESTSGFKDIYAYSSSKHKLIFKNVPAHRILGTYLMNCMDGQSTFLGDSENEFVTDLYGVEATWESSR